MKEPKVFSGNCLRLYERWLGVWERTLSRLWRTIYDDFVIDRRRRQHEFLAFRIHIPTIGFPFFEATYVEALLREGVPIEFFLEAPGKW